MKIFNYKPKSDIKTILKTFWAIPFALVIAIWQILTPSGISFF